MTREELIDYLEELLHSTGICYVCDRCGGLNDEDCKLRAVIDYLSRPLGERLIEMLREARGE